MGRACVYKMTFDGKEIIGTAKECAEASGYCYQMIGAIARGEQQPRKGVSIEQIDVYYSGDPADWRGDLRMAKKWDDTVAMFKNVEWVSKESGEGRRLKMIQGNGYRAYSS